MTSAQGAAELIEATASEERSRTLARAINRACERGMVLTRRLVGIARHDTEAADGTEPVLEPIATVTEVCHLLSTTLGSKHRLRFDVAAGPALVRGDRTELERAVMNLVVNARDATPGGGQIVVRVAPERVAGSETTGDPQAGCPERLQPGSYIRISVTDTGQGMTPEVLSRAGVLFFTTKPRGKGTGLGLAATRSFVERAGGCLAIESAEGRGTSVTMWLPEATADLRETRLETEAQTM
jgi:signal transduction histidine kinase